MNKCLNWEPVIVCDPGIDWKPEARLLVKESFEKSSKMSCLCVGVRSIHLFLCVFKDMKQRRNKCLLTKLNYFGVMYKVLHLDPLIAFVPSKTTAYLPQIHLQTLYDLDSVWKTSMECKVY